MGSRRKRFGKAPKFERTAKASSESFLENLHSSICCFFFFFFSASVEIYFLLYSFTFIEFTLINLTKC